MIDRTLKPDDDQQERRADKSRSLAELIERELSGGDTEAAFKGEAVDIVKSGKILLTITSNADDTFTIDNDGKKIGADHIRSALKSRLAP